MISIDYIENSETESGTIYSSGTYQLALDNISSCGRTV